MSKKAKKKGKQITTNEKNYIVTVVCVTYNHEEYIKDCLDGLVKQKTQYRFRVLVGDDCSADKTAEIVKSYAKRYPSIIFPFLRKKNLGSIYNFGDLCERAMKNSKYIAFCDGDDYWTDDKRLQKQVDFMLANPAFTGSICRANVLLNEKNYLNKYLRKNKDGNYYWPECQTNFKFPKSKTLRMADIVTTHCTHTVATMVKVRPNVQIPPWFYRGIVGDIPFFLFHIGNGQVGIMDDVMATYRRSDSGITMFKTIDENFMKTRPDYINYLVGIREYFVKNFKSFQVVAIENRIKQEVTNYFEVLMKHNRFDLVQKLIREYPIAFKLAFAAYSSFYRDSRQLTRIYGWDGYQFAVRNKYFPRLMRPVVRISLTLKKTKDKVVKKVKDFKALLSKIKMRELAKRPLAFIFYWLLALVPKKENQWVYTSFRHKRFMDNSKYFYLYMKENHKEINSIWVTKDIPTMKMLDEMGVAYLNTATFKGIWAVARASVAVTDHYVTTDYKPWHGFNARTKVVQLWHGVGLKAMGDGKKVKSVSDPTVRYSTDILAQKDDGILTKLKKGIMFFFKAHKRELFEKYFIMVCPGQERVDMIADMWNVPKENQFMCGHSRDIVMHKRRYDSYEMEAKKILYAPTFRWSVPLESAMVDHIVKNGQFIQGEMERLGCEIYLRLHPHTWRNHRGKLVNLSRKYDRIFLDFEKDIYDHIHEFHICISDYSSIAYDFVNINKPVIFMCFDYDEFTKKDAGFNLDYFAMTPGPKTYSWEESIYEVERYLDDSEKDSDLRMSVGSYFFDRSVNDENNSERIAEEIKRRLKIK